jgi:hypothetical protein
MSENQRLCLSAPNDAFCGDRSTSSGLSNRREPWRKTSPTLSLYTRASRLGSGGEPSGKNFETSKGPDRITLAASRRPLALTRLAAATRAVTNYCPRTQTIAQGTR